jgi:hypothetical protein
MPVKSEAKRANDEERQRELVETVHSTGSDRAFTNAEVTEGVVADDFGISGLKIAAGFVREGVRAGLGKEQLHQAYREDLREGTKDVAEDSVNEALKKSKPRSQP